MNKAEVNLVFTINLDSAMEGWSAEKQMTYYRDLLAENDLDTLVVFRDELISGNVKLVLEESNDDEH